MACLRGYLRMTAGNWVTPTCSIVRTAISFGYFASKEITSNIYVPPTGTPYAKFLTRET